MKRLSNIAATVLLLGASVASPAVLAAAARASAPAPVATVAHTTQGDDFWLAFEGNYDGDSNLVLSVTTTDSTTGTVEVPAVGLTQSFQVTAGEATQIPIPVGLQDLTNGEVRELGIHVTSVDPVTVTGLNGKEFSSDGFLVLPTELLGTHYLVQTYSSYLTYGSQFEVVATADATTVTITPSEHVGAHPARVPFSVTLQQGQTYQLVDATVVTGDLTGTDVTADRPIAVFAGNRCASVPVDAVACNTLAEELEPVDSWGSSFVITPFATRRGDLFRILAAQGGTTVTIDRSPPITLGAGDFVDRELSASAVLRASGPIQVMQYAHSHSADNATGDPFVVTVVPTSQYLTTYMISTPPSDADPQLTSHYLNVVAQSEDIGSISIDGAQVDTTAFAVVGGSSYSSAQLPILPGPHRVDGQRGLGVTVYGYGRADGYGYPAGIALSPPAASSAATPSPPASVVPRAPIAGTPTPGAAVDSTPNKTKGNGVVGGGDELAPVATVVPALAYRRPGWRSPYCRRSNDAG